MPTDHTLDFQKLFEVSPDLLIVLLPDFKIAAASDAYVKASNSVRENILGKDFFETFFNNPQDANSSAAVDVRASFEKVLRNRAADKMTVRKYDIPKTEGGGFEVRYWGSSNTPVLSATGDVLYIIRRAEDVTRIVLQDREKQTIEKERDLFFTHSMDLLAIVGTDGYFKRLNPAFERSMGYTDEELCAKPIVSFLHPDDVDKTKKRIKMLAEGSPQLASANRYRCKDGKYRWFSWNTTPLDNLLYTVGRDITEQVEFDDRIREMNQNLERKNNDLEVTIRERVTELRKSEAQVQQLQKMDAIGRLAGGIAHDFNNMLGAISLYCDLLIDTDELSSVAENVQNIREVTSRAAALTRQLLVFSRKQIVQHQTINLNPLINQLEKMLIRLIGENVKIVTKLADDLRSVNVDPSQMEQVILNLVVNARDAMPQGGRIVMETKNVYLDEAFTSMHLSMDRGHYVLFSISDEGIGMDGETLTKIFEPFFTTKPVGKGTGLGLTTTYGIIKQSHGTIWVYSELGKGTVFNVYLPIAEKIVEEAVLATSPISEVSGTQTILLVEDDEKLRAGFSTMLRKKGYQVLVAAEVKEALNFCKNFEEPIHLLLTDIVMPGMSGFELAKVVTTQRKDLRVLYMSGYTNDALENSGIENLGQLDFIQKPFSTSVLVSKVQDVLMQARVAQPKYN